MAHSIEIDEATGIIIITQMGRVTLEKRLKMLEEIRGKVPDKGDLKILSDLTNADIDMSSDELMRYGSIVAAEPRTKRGCIATVYKYDDPLGTLGETTAFLEGNNLRIASFTSVKEALQWLSEC
ncbi:MAG: hypothetical protein OQK25_05495 [Gammaproteobacteria bacterium]|nr:hypothetical protein [Gammaproteobacteria bacterium]MCW8982566.1 hypothetical protein [Gammaproteobacteria bacterium]